MSDNLEVSRHEGDDLASNPGDLRREPGWREKSRRPVLLALLAGMLFVAAGILLAWLWSARTQTTASAPGQPAVAGKQAAGCTGARLPIDVALQQIANGLHVPLDELESQARSGKTIQEIAAARGVSPDQLHTIELQALQTANDRWVGMGCITREDETTNMQRDTGTADYMNQTFTDWLNRR